jgi:hypothetical protein
MRCRYCSESQSRQGCGRVDVCRDANKPVARSICVSSFGVNNACVAVECQLLPTPVFSVENAKLAELTADDIEMCLRGRLKQRVRVKARDGFVEKSVLKATTVHPNCEYVAW